MSNPSRVIGRPRRRVDARAKVTGQTRFADDIQLPRMLHCRLLRSTQPHARILSIDVSKAQAAEGVHLVLTGEHFPIPYGILLAIFAIFITLGGMKVIGYTDVIQVFFLVLFFFSSSSVRA